MTFPIRKHILGWLPYIYVPSYLKKYMNYKQGDYITKEKLKMLK